MRARVLLHPKSLGFPLPHQGSCLTFHTLKCQKFGNRVRSGPVNVRFNLPVSRQLHGNASKTQADNDSTWKRMRKHPRFVSAVILLTLVIDATYALVVYSTGGLEESPISPYKDPFFGSILQRIFPRQVKEPLHPNEFRPFLLLEKERISDTSSILTLQPAQSNTAKGKPDPYAIFSEKGIWSVEIKQPQLQIARRYTPLPANLPPVTEPSENEDQTQAQESQTQGLPLGSSSSSQNLHLLIRRDPTGEVSNYLHRLPIGAKLDIRGGYTEYGLPKDITEVLFLAGGTGVAPAMQVAHTLAWRYVHKDHDGVGMRILWANRYREECAGGVNIADAPSPRSWFFTTTAPTSPTTVTIPIVSTATVPNTLVDHLTSLEQSGTCLRLSTTYFVDEESTYITRDTIVTALATLSAPPGETTARPQQGRKLILISGPDGFVEYLAGPKRFWSGVEEQGVTGGVLAQCDLRGWEVRRL